MKHLLRGFAVLVALGAASLGQAAELVMVDSKACVYCMRFHREVGRTYAETAPGQIAPLRRVNRLKKWPADLADVTPVYYTPVFILVEEGREIGRFPGYATPEKFWSQLEPLLAKLEAPAPEPDEPVVAEAPAVPTLPSAVRKLLLTKRAGLW